MSKLNAPVDAALAAAGPDTVTGGAGADVLNGSSFGDRLNGAGGADVIRGLGGNDTVDGGDGDDRFFWTLGDGSDLVEGGAGVDTQFFDRDGAYTLSASGGRALVRVGSDTVSLDGVEVLNLQALTGAASFTLGDLSATDIRQVVIQLDSQDVAANTIGLTGAAVADAITVQALSASGLRVLDTAGGVLETTVISGLGARDRVTIDGGAGDDSIMITTPSGDPSAALLTARGGEGADSLNGSAGGEVLHGDAGADAINGGGGKDTIDGGAGLDTQTITGVAEADVVTLVASGGHVLETIGGLTTDVVNVETINVRPMGQADTIRIGDLASAGVTRVNVDLSGANGAQDGQADAVILTAPLAGTDIRFTSSADSSASQAVYTRNGAAVQTVNVTGMGAGDALQLAGGVGSDVFSTFGFASQTRVLVDGGAGANTQVFGGTAGNDTFTLAANGSHAELTLNGSAPLDLVNVQTVSIAALGGFDTVQIDDLRATDVRSVTVDLAGANGQPDGLADTVNVKFAGTGVLSIGGVFFDSFGTVLATVKDDGAPVQTARIVGFDDSDQIVVNFVSDIGLYALKNVAPAGATFRFSDNSDFIDWQLNLGQNRGGAIDGGAGSDTLQFSVDDNPTGRDGGTWEISVNSNGASDVIGLHRLKFDSSHPTGLELSSTFTTRNIESLQLEGGAEADKFRIELDGTAIRGVDIELGGGGPAGDGKADVVEFSGTRLADVMTVAHRGNGDIALSSRQTQSGEQFGALLKSLDGKDTMILHAGGGDDLIDLNAFFNRAEGVLVVDSGTGNDTIVASDFGNAAVVFDFDAAGGNDVVVNFGGLAGQFHRIDVSSTNDNSLAELLDRRHLFQSGSDVVLTDGAGAILTLKDITLAELTNGHFIF